MDRVNPAEEVRKALKQKGITSRRVSVRSDGNSLCIRIKDLSVCAEMVTEIAKQFERIDYCHMTQEILCGGNYFVSVSYDWQTESEVKKSPQFLALKEKISQKLSTISGNTGVEVVEGFTAFLAQNGFSYQATVEWKPDQYWHHFGGAEDIALELYRDALQGKIKQLEA
jgi:hypothetical protein